MLNLRLFVWLLVKTRPPNWGLSLPLMSRNTLKITPTASRPPKSPPLWDPSPTRPHLVPPTPPTPLVSSFNGLKPASTWRMPIKKQSWTLISLLRKCTLKTPKKLKLSEMSFPDNSGSMCCATRTWKRPMVWDSSLSPVSHKLVKLVLPWVPKVVSTLVSNTKWPMMLSLMLMTLVSTKQLSTNPCTVVTLLPKPPLPPRQPPLEASLPLPTLSPCFSYLLLVFLESSDDLMIF